MHQRLFWTFLLSLVLVSGSYSKCIFAPVLRANVHVQSCVAVTFAPSDMTLDFGGGRTGRLYEPGATFSGTLLSVRVTESHFVWETGEIHRTNNFQPWKHGEGQTLFIALPVDQVCPPNFEGTLVVETERDCCDVLPVKGKCLVPDTIVSVRLSSK
jgi:hypothetical protein